MQKTEKIFNGNLKLLALFLSLSSYAHASPPTISLYDTTDKLIIKWKEVPSDTLESQSQPPNQSSEQKLNSLIQRSGIHVTTTRRLKNGLDVLQLPSQLSLSEAGDLARSLSTDSEIEYAEPDRLLQPQLEPGDWAYTSYQWHYYDKNTELASANLPAAWDITTGHNSIVIAVLDSGILPHADLVGRTLPGYDFINNSYISNDGDGRDNDPTDPGDWITASESAGTDPNTGAVFTGCPARNSSWHGTHVSGTIVAAVNSGGGAAGINWVSKVVPVRVLGKCGGFLSDIVDGMRWAAGLAVTGTPANANPAHVINMSLGGAFECATSPTYQNAINEITASGVTIVVAAGNSNLDASGFTPAGCDNVITVAANNRLGGRASYSNFGSTVEITAPGGQSPLNPNGILSTLDSGTTTALNDNTLSFSQGTSMATPHVSGVVSLMLSAYYTLTNTLLTPAQLTAKLTASARAFPTSTGSDCNNNLCGAGLLDGEQALLAVTTAPSADAGNNRAIQRGALTTLDASASFDDGSIVSYIWSQLSGTAVTINNANASTANFTAPTSLGPLVFQVTVTDDLGFTDSASVTLDVISGNAPPNASANAVSTNEDTPLQSTLLASDPDSDILTYEIVLQPVLGAVSINNINLGSYTYTPSPNNFGTDTFSFKVNDGAEDSNTATVTITINSINDQPTADNKTYTIDEDTTLNGVMSGQDVENSPLIFQLNADVTKGNLTLDGATGNFSYQPEANASGTDNFTYRISDGELTSNLATVTINITPLNDPPQSSNGTLNTDEDIAVTGQLNGNDPDNDPLFYSIISNPNKGTAILLSAETGQFTYTPNSNAHGTDSFSYQISDGALLSATATVEITIHPINDAPVLTTPNIHGVIMTTDSLTTLTLGLEDPDISTDNDQHSYSTSNFTLGTITLTDNTMTIEALVPGQETLTVTATDSMGASSSISLVVTVSESQGKNADNNQDGIADSLATQLGLDETESSGDSDGDGIADTFELGDPFNPIDSDNDNVIDALEIGQAAFNDKVIFFKVNKTTADQLGLPDMATKNLKLNTEMGLRLSSHNNGNLGIPLYDSSTLIANDTNASYPFGYIDLSIHATTSTTTVTLTMPSDIPINSNTQLKKRDSAGIWRTYTDYTLDLTGNTVTFTLVDNDTLDANPSTGVIRNTVAIAIPQSTLSSINSVTNNGGGGGGGYLNIWLVTVLFIFFGIHQYYRVKLQPQSSNAAHHRPIIIPFLWLSFIFYISLKHDHRRSNKRL